MSDEIRPDEPERVVVRDKRKIDPLTGEARRPDPSADAPGGAPQGAPEAQPELPSPEALLLEERTRDLQRVQAEYANYRKRADRDRLAAGELAVGRVLAELIPVLDDLDRAREHGDLTGGLKAISERIDGVVGKLGLSTFGEVGDPFDPAIHEAVLHNESDDVSVPTCTMVMRRGYQHGERLLRAAMVGVSDPSTPPPPAPAAPDAASDAAPETGPAGPSSPADPGDAPE